MAEAFVTWSNPPERMSSTFLAVGFPTVTAVLQAESTHSAEYC